MNININHQWRIRSDELQWNVEYLPNPKPGTKRKTERWKAKGHFRTLDEAVLRCARRQIRLLGIVVGADALPCLCTALDRIEAEIREAVGGLRVEDIAAEQSCANSRQ